MPQPEAYIGEAAKLFEANGSLNNKTSRDFLTKFMTTFVLWVEENKMQAVNQ